MRRQNIEVALVLNVTTWFTVKSKHLFLGDLTCFSCENKEKRTIFFKDRPTFSHIKEKLSPKPIELCG